MVQQLGQVWVWLLAKIMQMSGLRAGMCLETSKGHLWVGSGCWSLGTRAQEGDCRDQGNPQQLCVCDEGPDQQQEWGRGFESLYIQVAVTGETRIQGQLLGTPKLPAGRFHLIYILPLKDLHSPQLE